MFTNLPHRITIQSLTATSAGGGTYTEAWTTVSTVWANVQTKGSESTAEGKIQQFNQYDIIVRDGNYTNQQRIIFNGQIIHIEQVTDPTNRNRMTVIKGRGELGS